MSEETLVLVGINPQTRKCEVVTRDSENAWLECRELGLIPFRVPAKIARGLFDTEVPCIDALLPHPAGNTRVIWARVVAPELGDNVFAGIAAQALRSLANFNESSGGDETVRTGITGNEGISRYHASIHWPLWG